MWDTVDAPAGTDGDNLPTPPPDDAWPDGAWLEPPCDPDPATTIDLYDYDRWCLTDLDLADQAHRELMPAVNPGARGRGVDVDDIERFLRERATVNAGDRDEPGRSGPDGGGRDWAWWQERTEQLHEEAVLSLDVLPGDRCRCGGVLAVRPGTVEAQIRFSTLAGLDEHPGLIAGFGITLARFVRQIAADPALNPTWRWSVFAEDGQLLHHGITMHRPTGQQSRPRHGRPASGRMCACARFEPGRRRSTLEIQLTPAQLAYWRSHPEHVPGWHNVLADIAAQLEHDRQANRPGKWEQTGPDGTPSAHGHTGRMPNATEDAFIRARDRSCRAPGCPTIASRCDIDHRLEHAKGGPAHRGNCQTRCRRHHRLRDRLGFHITRTGPTTTWHLPHGTAFPVTGKDLILALDD